MNSITYLRHNTNLTPTVTKEILKNILSSFYEVRKTQMQKPLTHVSIKKNRIAFMNIDE